MSWPPKVLSADWRQRVSEGKVLGSTRVIGLGFNPDVDLVDLPEGTWGGAGPYPWFTAATGFELLSTSANDTADGTGARTILVRGLEAGTYMAQQEIVTLNGVGVVPLALQYGAINSLSVYGPVGSAETNVGDVVLRRAGGGITQGIILAGRASSLQSNYTVPAGYTLYVHQLAMSISQGAGDRRATIAAILQAPGEARRVPLYLSGSDGGQPSNIRFEFPIPVMEKNRFELSVIEVTAATNTVLTAAWEGVLVLN